MAIDFAADLETPVSAFLKLKPLQPVFLLESAERNETVGRFSFIGILPKQFFVLRQNEDHKAFFSNLNNLLGSLVEETDTRFSSGLVGFLSYHVSALLHPKLSSKRTDFPLASFVLPSAVLTFDHLKRRLILSSILPEEEQVELAAEIRKCLRQALTLPAVGKGTAPYSSISREQFYGMVERAKELIRSGDIYQVVLSMPFEGESKAHPFTLYRALRMINPSPYMFYFDFQNDFQFFGSSPETMVRTERTNGSRRIVLRPIAGTRPRGRTQEEDQNLQEDLLHDEKEKAEHLMLLDLARNDLGRLAQAGTVKVSDFMKIERYSHVMHLVSTVESKVETLPDAPELLRAVFPAGTVSGAPKLRAMQIIDELEPHSRGLYAGSLGYFGAGGIVDHCIAIRCMLKQGDRYSFTAGAGIVADSVPEREYEEIANKAMALRTVLKMGEEEL